MGPVAAPDHVFRSRGGFGIGIGEKLWLGWICLHVTHIGLRRFLICHIFTLGISQSSVMEAGYDNQR